MKNITMRFAREAAGNCFYWDHPEDTQKHHPYTSMMGKEEAAENIQEAAEPLLAVVRRVIELKEDGDVKIYDPDISNIGDDLIEAARKAIEVCDD